MAAPTPAARPNILLITSDQQRGDCFGFENPEVRTPHLDLLAQGGTRFSACITPNLVCQPSRASMLTGLLPLTHGVADNGIDLDPQTGAEGWAGQLGAAGYRTGFIGKAHFATKTTFQPTGTPECRTSSADFGPDWRGPYMGFEHVELTVLGHSFRGRPLRPPPHNGAYEQFFFAQGAGEQEALAWELWEQEVGTGVGAAQTWTSALPVAWHNSTWIGDRSAQYLEAHDRSQPFALWLSFPDPHHPFDCPAPWVDQYDPNSLTLPEHRVMDLERRPWWHKASLEGEPVLADPKMKSFRTQGSRMPPQTDEQLRHMTANYYGMVSLIDHNVGRVLAQLAASGLAENTVVIYTTDHGDLLGDHGLYLKGPTPYEGLLRVGMVCSGPGVSAGQVNSEPVSTLDLGATFCEYGGIELPEGAQSRSLTPLLAGSGHRDVAYSEWNVNASRCGVALELRTVRTKSHKLTLELASGAGELYDLENDPQEMTSLFDEVGYRPVRKELEDMVRARPGKLLKEFAEPVGMA